MPSGNRINFLTLFYYYSFSSKIHFLKKVIIKRFDCYTINNFPVSFSIAKRDIERERESNYSLLVLIAHSSLLDCVSGYDVIHSLLYVFISILLRGQ